MTEPGPSLPDHSRAVLAAVRAAEAADGRLAAPSAEALGDIFPFEGALRVRRVDDPVLPEPSRHDESARLCGPCGRADSTYLWVDSRWRLTSAGDVDNLPVVVLLEPRAHVDLGELDAQHAAELGPLTVAIERAIRADPGVGRVHVNRWGDGGAHFHLWFIGRPAGLLQLRGSPLPVWLDVLPSLEPDIVRDARVAVADRLVGAYGGRQP